jgi:hypothetical protein
MFGFLALPQALFFGGADLFFWQYTKKPILEWFVQFQPEDVWSEPWHNIQYDRHQDSHFHESADRGMADLYPGWRRSGSYDEEVYQYDYDSDDSFPLMDFYDPNSDCDADISEDEN